VPRAMEVSGLTLVACEVGPRRMAHVARPPSQLPTLIATWPPRVASPRLEAGLLPWSEMVAAFKRESMCQWQAWSPSAAR
jgi:hypothetical protein